MEKTIYSTQVIQDWVDYNGHLNDAEYARIFSLSVDAFMKEIGITDEFREANAYSMFTLETHVCYLDEVNLDEKVDVQVQLLDHDAKRTHIMFTMLNAAGERAATSEQMLMGMDMSEHRPAPFPETVQANVDKLARDQQDMEAPKEAGKTIGIRRKK
ncbi:MAG TPA: thioesterase family protein [Pseudogracilibacillus sp.]|nr:thioesterase family protein [Pseudogracilibacillus sp.]